MMRGVRRPFPGNLKVTSRHEGSESGGLDTHALLESLRRWRWKEAMTHGVPPHLVLPNTVLDGIVRLQPANPKELAAVPGMDARTLERHGPVLLALVLEASDLRGPPTAAPGFEEDTAGQREALRALLQDLWGCIAASCAWSMTTEEPIPTASGKSHLTIDTITPSAISYHAGKGGPQAVTRREIMAAAKRILLGGGRAFTLEELGMENSSHLVVFLALTPFFETGYDRKVVIRARLDALAEDAKAALVAEETPAAPVNGAGGY